jgi:epoxide hydrolase
MTAKSFSVNISQETLDHLRHRLAKTRLPDEVEDADWDYGTNLDYLKELVRYWQNDFDWRSREAELNCFNHFQTEIDDCKIHFIHEKGAGANSSSDFSTSSVGRRCHAVDILPPLKNRNC